MGTSATIAQSSRTFWGWVLLGLFVEVAVFAAACAYGPAGFVEQISGTDSAEYVRVGEHLVQEGTLPPTNRTLGYPLFLAGCFLIGGETYVCHVAVAVQLAVNLAFSVWFWFALPRYAPRLTPRLRTLALILWFITAMTGACICSPISSPGSCSSSSSTD